MIESGEAAVAPVHPIAALPLRWRVILAIGSGALAATIFAIVALFTGNYVRASVASPTDLSQIEGMQLKELIRKVKTDLVAADDEARKNNELYLFRLKDFELDINVVASGKAETRGQLMTVGSNVTVGREKVQKIHLRWVVDPERRELTALPAEITAAPTKVYEDK